MESSSFWMSQPLYLVQAMYNNMSGHVFHQNMLSEEFTIMFGLKQECVLAPILFSLYLAAMLHKPPPDYPGFDIRY